MSYLKRMIFLYLLGSSLRHGDRALLQARGLHGNRHLGTNFILLGRFGTFGLGNQITFRMRVRKRKWLCKYYTNIKLCSLPVPYFQLKILSINASFPET
jgi:hypothetical protein